MTVTAPMLDAHPTDVPHLDPSRVRVCIDACAECAQVCTACADACLSEHFLAGFRTYIRAGLDCADVCHATGRVLSRHNDHGAKLTRAVLEACAVACEMCGDECASHADMHAHCRVCAEACRRCETVCRDLIASM
jgi:Domain of Unknown Function (DUF326)